jgi:hypothetical protein
LYTGFPGLRTQLGVSTEPALKGPTPPIRIGWAINWSSGNFAVKARAAYIFNQYVVPVADRADPGVLEYKNCFWFNVMPNYTMGNITIFCDIGVEQNRVTGDGMLDELAWWVNPYVRYGNLRAGLLVRGDTRENSNIRYRVPILAVFSF